MFHASRLSSLIRDKIAIFRCAGDGRGNMSDLPVTGWLHLAEEWLEAIRITPPR
jgi:hypothetical protein